jgi:acyl carrier protein
VLAREDTGEDKCLVAYVIATPKGRPTTRELRSFLEKKLPKYMLPAAFVILDSFPLNANGKVDYKSLPVPDYAGAGQANKTIEPRNDIECRLTAIWKKLLGISTLGVQDNFFEVGGHSLLAMNLVARIEKDFGRSIPLAAVFEKPTIEKLAELLRDRETTLQLNWLVPLHQGGAKPPVISPFMAHDRTAWMGDGHL